MQVIDLHRSVSKDDTCGCFETHRPPPLPSPASGEGREGDAPHHEVGGGGSPLT